MDIIEIPLDDERVAVVEAKPAGWAGDLPVKRLLEALQANGVPEAVWPGAPSDNKCLERALESLRTHTSLIRPLAKGRGWSLILESKADLDLEKLDNDGKNAHRVELTCKVEREEFQSALSGIRVTPDSHPAVPLIKQEFMRYRGENEGEGLFKCAQDLSYWFSQIIVPWCQGVATRSRGGSYYIMKGKYLERMILVAKALEQASTVGYTALRVDNKILNLPKVHLGGKILLKPEVATTAAIEILIDNIINECDKTTDQLSEKLNAQDVGSRGLASQKGLADDMLLKLKEYETLLNTNLTDVRGRLEEMQANIGMAELRLLAEGK